MACLSQPRQKGRAPWNAAERGRRDRHERTAATVTQNRRPGRAGDICVLFAPSRSIAPAIQERLTLLRAEFGGRIVDPLHLTLERTDGEDADGLVAAVRACAARMRPVAVRGEELFVTPSPYRGGDVLKLHVARDEELTRAIGEVRSALLAAGLRSSYGDVRSTSVTVLERVERRGSLERWPRPLELFTADELIVSRIVDASTYDILDTATVPTSG